MGLKTKAARLFRRLLQEEFLASQPLRVDRDQGIIYGVKILGRFSRNRYGEDVEGTEYTESAITGARKLYEGVKVNCDHPPRDGKASDRPVEKRIGKLFNIRVEDGELYGDWRLLKSHPMYERLMEAAESMPDAFALSHVAHGRTQIQDGKLVVNEIREVNSVDVVADGATNRSLFDSLEPEGPPMKKPTTVRQLLESAPAKQKSTLLKLLREMGEMGDTMGAVEVEPEADKDPLDMLGEVVGALAAKKDAESFELARKILAMLKPGGAGGGEKKTAESDDDKKRDDKPKDDEKKTEESLRTELDQLKRDKSVRELCEDLEFLPTRTQFKALVALAEDDREAFAKELKESAAAAAKPAAPAPSGPRSSGPGRKFQESRLDGVKDAKGFAAALIG